MDWLDPLAVKHYIRMVEFLINDSDTIRLLHCSSLQSIYVSFREQLGKLKYTGTYVIV